LWERQEAGPLPGWSQLLPEGKERTEEKMLNGIGQNRQITMSLQPV
jgi:hypothetical protein